MSKRTILLDALASMPKDLTFMLRRADETAVHQRRSPDEWSIADVLRHLRTTESLYLARLQRIVAEERPYLPYIHPESRPQPEPTPLSELLHTLSTARSETLTYLQSLNAGAWQRNAVHETLGPTKLRYMVQLLVDHDTEHLNQIVRLLEATRSNMK
ncbi:MAG: hypothetical protein CL608_33395 [Anaerolineaceae bacterium]|nr:hypothetical protein [Anaerolineaceae bacterium]